MKEQGLYSPLFEHENCGAGFICSLKGIKTNDIIHRALNILTCLEQVLKTLHSQVYENMYVPRCRKPEIRLISVFRHL